MKQILNNMVNILRDTLNLNEKTCFVSIAPVIPPTINNLLIEVIPGDQSTKDDGLGFQAGGALLQGVGVDVVIFKRSFLDVKGFSEKILVDETNAMIDIQDKVIESLMFSFLSGELVEPLMWIATSRPGWADEDSGIATQTISFTGSKSGPNIRRT